MTQFIKSAIEAVEGRLSLAGQLNAARKTLETHLDDKLMKIEEQIPRHILQNAQGIIFLSEVSASYGYGARIGTGIIIGKLEKSEDLENKTCEWSGPISIKTSSINYGLQYGASMVDHIIILKNRELVANFMEKGSLQIGVDAAFAVGPLGRDAQIGVNFNFDHLSPILSYSVDTKGLYIGVNLEGSIINVRNECNESFYSASNISAQDVLSGKIKAPMDNDDYRRIVELLDKYCDKNNKEANAEIENAKGQLVKQLENLKDFTKETTDNIMNVLAGDPAKQLREKVNELASDLQDKGQQIVDKIENEISTKQSESTAQEKKDVSTSNQEPKIESQDQPKKKSKKAKSEKKTKKSKKTKNQQKNAQSPLKNMEENSANKEENLQENPQIVIEQIQKRIGQLKEISKQESPEDERQKIAQAKLKLQQYMDQ